MRYYCLSQIDIDDGRDSSSSGFEFFYFLMIVIAGFDGSLDEIMFFCLFLCVLNEVDVVRILIVYFSFCKHNCFVLIGLDMN